MCKNAHRKRAAVPSSRSDENCKQGPGARRAGARQPMGVAINNAPGRLSPGRCDVHGGVRRCSAAHRNVFARQARRTRALKRVPMYLYATLEMQLATRFHAHRATVDLYLQYKRSDASEARNYLFYFLSSPATGASSLRRPA